MATNRASTMRCGDTDREKVVAALRDNYAEGRLTLDEFDQRSDAAYQARTFGDLAPLLADLPHAPLEPTEQPAAPSKPAKPAVTPRPARVRLAPWTGIIAVLMFISVVGIGMRGFWPFWLLIPTFIIMSGGLRHHRGRSYGPEGQLRDEARDLRVEHQRLRIQEQRARIERRRQRLDRRRMR